MLCVNNEIVNTNSAQIIFFIAFSSSISRAGVNVLDRYLIGLKRYPIIVLSLINNLLPAVVVMIFSLYFLDGCCGIWVKFFNWKFAVIGGLIQLTAYAFSFAFRVLTVNQVTCATKVSDVLIPFGILFSTGNWSFGAYGFAIASTVLSLPLIWDSRYQHEWSGKLLACGLICLVLLLQAMVIPLLAEQPVNALSSTQLFLMITSVIWWRTFWSLLPMIRKLCAYPRKIHLKISGMRSSTIMLLAMRSVLTVFTQTTFLICVSSASANIAWPILNSAGFFGMWMAGWFLSDHLTRREVVVIVAVTVLNIVSLFWV